MNKRVLGRTGIEVSEISFGTVSIGIPYGIGAKGQNQMLPEDKAIRLLRTGLDNGINFFDTARLYGRSEELIGKVCASRRDEVVICTKCTHLRKNGELPSDGQLQQIIDLSFSQSLRYLQSDYVDVYMIHNADLEILNNNRIAEIFNEYKTKGLARAIGVSVYSIEETRKAIESGVWDVIQLSYNLMDQRQAELFSFASQKGVGIVVRSVLFKGILTDKGSSLHSNLKAIEQHRNLYNSLLTDKVPTLYDLAIKFVLSNKEVSSALIGIDRKEYLDKAVALADGDFLDEQTMSKVKKLVYPDPDFLNLPKWDRLGWL